MRITRRNKTRFSFSLPEILNTRHSKGLRRSRARARTYENQLRLPLALLNR